MHFLYGRHPYLFLFALFNCVLITLLLTQKKKALISVLIATFQPKKLTQLSCFPTQTVNLSTSTKNLLKLINKPCLSMLIVLANLLASIAKCHFGSETINWAQICIVLVLLTESF